MIPDSTYAVELLGNACMGNELSCADVSGTLAVATARWGDTDGNNVTNAVDIGVTVDKVKDVLGAVVEPIAIFQPRLPNPVTFPVTALDLAASVDAVKGFAYRYDLTCTTTTACTITSDCAGAEVCSSSGFCTTVRDECDYCQPQ